MPGAVGDVRLRRGVQLYAPTSTVGVFAAACSLGAAYIAGNAIMDRWHCGGWVAMVGVKVELKDKTPPVYVYEDENLRLEIPIPPLDVFLAFVRELDKLGAEAADAEAHVTILARAFWLLHQRPRKRRLFRKRYVVPAVDEEEALTLLKEKVRRGDVAVKSLAPALFESINHVMGGGRADGEPPTSPSSTTAAASGAPGPCCPRGPAPLSAAPS